MKNPITRSLLFFILLVTFYQAYSQNPEWINYTWGQDVRALVEDGEFIWVGTVGGLVKLNITSGNMTFYNKANSGLPDNCVITIAIDGSGNIWVAAVDSGLVKFDGTNWTVYNTSNSGLPVNYVSGIAIDGAGNK